MVQEEGCPDTEDDTPRSLKSLHADELGAALSFLPPDGLARLAAVGDAALVDAAEAAAVQRLHALWTALCPRGVLRASRLTARAPGEGAAAALARAQELIAIEARFWALICTRNRATKAELEARGFCFPSIDELLDTTPPDASSDDSSASDASSEARGGANYAVPGMYGGFYGVRLARDTPPRPFLRLVRTNAKTLEAAAWSAELERPRPSEPTPSAASRRPPQADTLLVDDPRCERTDAPRRGAWTLTCDSWCRVCGGSGETHEITPTETRLLEEGFC